MTETYRIPAALRESFLLANDAKYLRLVELFSGATVKAEGKLMLAFDALDTSPVDVECVEVRAYQLVNGMSRSFVSLHIDLGLTLECIEV